MAKKKSRYSRALIGPDGKKYIVRRGKTREFAEKHGLSYPAMDKLFRGTRSRVKGWLSLVHPDFERCLAEANMYLINIRTNEIIKKPYRNKEFCDRMGVNRDCASKLIRGIYRQAGGWMQLKQYELIYGKIDQNRLLEAGE